MLIDISKYFEFNEKSFKFKLIQEIGYQDQNFALSYYVDENHKQAIGIAKSVVHDLNKFIYKHKITHSVANLLLASIGSNLNFYGKIDLILKSEKDWFLCLFKFSKSPFEAKYKYEAILQKKLIESNSNIKISRVFVFNPLNDIIIKEFNL